MRKKIIIIGGPNGAGKTTFARTFLPVEAQCLNFINADLIAAGLSPFAPERAAFQAGRLMLEAMSLHVARRDSFAFETTLSGQGYARQIPVWQRAGYEVDLFFLSLPCADMAVERVAERVRQGGHHVPEPVIRRRFEAGLRLLTQVYQPLVNRWAVYDNAGDEPVLTGWSDAAMPTPRLQEPEPVYEGLPRHASAALLGSLQAMRRAAQRAREVARQTGTALIVQRDGRVVRVDPTKPGPP